MAVSFFKKNIVFKLISWHFIEVPCHLKRSLINFLKFAWHFFSIGFHFKTLFSHWHHYQDVYPKTFDPKRYLEVFAGNLLSRIVGFFVRTVTISAGLVFEVVIFLGVMFSLFFWIFLPLILAAGFVWGLRLVL